MTAATTVPAADHPRVLHPWLIAGALLLALAAAFILDVLFGPADLAPGTALRLLFSPDGSANAELVQSVRLPRVVSGVAAGAALGASGVLLQAVLRNPLAESGTIGINAGAYLAITLAAVAGVSAGALASLPFALLGAGLAAALVLLLGRGSGDPVRLILAGVAIAMAATAATSSLLVLNQKVGPGLFLWGAGSLEQTGWAPVRAVSWIVPALILATLPIARELDVLGLGSDHAESLGVKVVQIELAATSLAVGLSAISVALVGPIGFIGLAAPHALRRAGIRNHRPLVLLSAFAGALLLVLADVIALVVGGRGVSAGIISTLVGAPLLIWVARRLPVQPPIEALRRSSNALHHRPRAWVGLPLAVIFMLGTVFISLCIGELSLSPGQVLNGLVGNGDEAFIVRDLRLPRTLVAASAGAALAVSGAVLQGITRNPLAAPELLGVVGGAALGGLIALVVAGTGIGAATIAAFAGGVLALVVVTVLTPRNLDPLRLALIGVAVATVCAGLTDAIVARSGEGAERALIFLSGSTYAEGWGDLVALVPALAAGALIAWYLARRIDALACGDDLATSLGTPVVPARRALVLVAALLAAAAVATCGAITFVGLAAPHAARLLVGAAHRQLLPASAALGAALLVIADLLGRTVLSGAVELPSGLVTALLGAPILMLLLRRA